MFCMAGLCSVSLMWREHAREALARTDRDTARLHSRPGAWEGDRGDWERGPRPHLPCLNAHIGDGRPSQGQ